MYQAETRSCLSIFSLVAVGEIADLIGVSHRTFVTPPTKRSSVSIGQRLAQYPGSTEPAAASIDQPLQLNWCNVPESPCHWRSFGSDHRLPLLLAKSMLAN